MRYTSLENSFTQKVLHILSVNGLLHYDGLKILDAHKVYQSRKIREMEEKGWVRIREKNIKLYHCEKKYKEYEEYMYEGAKENCLQATSRVRTSNSTIYDRAKRSGDIYALLTESGVEYLMLPDLEEREELGKGAYFYSSRAIKNRIDVTVDETVIKSSRSHGQILTPSETYVLFNNEKSDLRYSATSELIYYNALKELLIKNYPGRKTDYKAIIYTHDYNTLTNLLNTKSRRDKRGRIIRSKNFNCDIAIYDEIYLVPLTYTGARIQELMLESDWKEMMDSFVIPEIEVRKNRYSYQVECDGVRNINGKTIYELNFLKGNIKSLSTFLKATEYYKGNNGISFVLHGFEHQKEALEKLIKDTNCEIKVYTISDIWNYFWESEE